MSSFFTTNKLLKALKEHYERQSPMDNAEGELSEEKEDTNASQRLPNYDGTAFVTAGRARGQKAKRKQIEDEESGAETNGSLPQSSAQTDEDSEKAAEEPGSPKRRKVSAEEDYGMALMEGNPEETKMEATATDGAAARPVGGTGHLFSLFLAIVLAEGELSEEKEDTNASQRLPNYDGTAFVTAGRARGQKAKRKQIEDEESGAETNGSLPQSSAQTDEDSEKAAEEPGSPKRRKVSAEEDYGMALMEGNPEETKMEATATDGAAARPVGETKIAGEMNSKP
ncbi:hypothetical protein SKAU_G00426340 [Synaphobranchus kaupii]|uniref:Uncharacterized protein n=1 Tax=Synaphobranchus kaupii TaxID=118154 RepID=A0A9Q1IAF2_SYNKA|nr:hypothetical protein SKAU_G00426340 [Synaphobranchus kaupii]